MNHGLCSEQHGKGGGGALQEDWPGAGAGRREGQPGGQASAPRSRRVREINHRNVANLKIVSYCTDLCKIIRNPSVPAATGWVGWFSMLLYGPPRVELWTKVKNTFLFNEFKFLVLERTVRIGYKLHVI